MKVNQLRSDEHLVLRQMYDGDVPEHVLSLASETVGKYRLVSSRPYTREGLALVAATAEAVQRSKSARPKPASK